MKTVIDIQRGIDSFKGIVLVAIELKALFHTLDHSLFLRISTKRFGLRGKALNWLKSYLKHRQQSVVINSSSSKPLPMKSGVPQGSILGPSLFSMYLIPLGDMLREKNISYQMYDVDTMLCFDCKTCQEQDKIKVNKIFALLKEAGLNGMRKTKVIAIGAEKWLADWKTINIVDGVINVNDSFISLGVAIGNKLLFRKQVLINSRTCFFYLRQLFSLKRFLSQEKCHLLVRLLLSVA